jgi:D-arabinose 1-dehydrogenase-like Zn-dependent alcohol dehydrogenase
MQLGATKFIDSSNKDFAKEHALEFDVIISTTDASQHDFPINDYLSYIVLHYDLMHSMLNINGNFNQCGLPNEDLPNVSPFTFASVYSL